MRVGRVRLGLSFHCLFYAQPDSASEPEWPPARRGMPNAESGRLGAPGPGSHEQVFVRGAEVSLLSKGPALAGGVGKEHEVSREPIFFSCPCRRQVGRLDHWCFWMEPVFEHGSEPFAGVHGDGGSLCAASRSRLGDCFFCTVRAAWHGAGVYSNASKTEEAPVRHSIAGAHH